MSNRAVNNCGVSEFHVNITGELNNVWRSATENVVKLKPKDAELQVRNAIVEHNRIIQPQDRNGLRDTYTICYSDHCKVLQIAVVYDKSHYKEDLRQLRFTWLNGAWNVIETPCTRANRQR